ncbi:atrial natriuretic peptide receptor 1-like [Anneissia japonica]|uniref:atrial natriuretic peptide receptor 1-like n=1 Tax=Anneissia japonica TaxID=1529436 RepID=UPI0014256837|nr:atrial natriuretic peptide receptor 1-like [Anneissia japonica]XP_033122631.1 atrial natriuretic peptide receptor 1-like [Anneissia japonica]
MIVNRTQFILFIPLIRLALSVGSYGVTSDIVLSVMLPYTGRWPIGSHIATAAAIAVDDIQGNSSLLPNRSIAVILNDTKCEAVVALPKVINLLSNEVVNGLHGFIGGGCNSVCEPIGLLAAAFNLPMISWGCTSTSLSDKLEYPTFVRTVGPYYKVTPMILEMFSRFNWSRAAILYSSEEAWQLTSLKVRNIMQDAGIFISQYYSFEPGPEKNIFEDKSFTETQNKARIILIFGCGGDVRDVMLHSLDLGMINGEYIFFTVDLFDYAYVGNNTWMGDDGRDDDALLAFGSIFNIHILEPSTQRYKYFTAEVRKRMATDLFGDSFNAEYKVDVHAATLYDAIHLYAVALHEVIEAGEDEYNGRTIVSKLLNKGFDGISGRVSIDKQGDRYQNFALQDVGGKDTHDIAEYYSEEKLFIFTDDVIIWPSGSTIPPKGHPDCGWDNEYCQTPLSFASIIGVSVGTTFSVAFVLLCVLVACMCRRYFNYELVLNNFKLWLVDYDDIDFRLQKSQYNSRPRSVNNSSSNTSAKSVGNGADSRTTSPSCFIPVDSMKYCRVGYYKGNVVAVKPVKKTSVLWNRELFIEMKMMMELQHVNINHFVGVCTVAPNIGYIMIYCNKGSLRDVMANSDITIDEHFKLSFASDIAQGLLFLSLSQMKHHGNLKSSNCVVDSHWVCKLTDFGFSVFRTHERVDNELDENEQCKKLLWTAPEILRQTTVDQKKLSIQADVYAYGIILQEIVLRTGPFASLLEVIEPRDLIQSVRLGTVPKVRPAVPSDSCKKQTLNLMKACWDEDPEKRPTIKKIIIEIKEISGGGTINIIDNMIRMMEKYANNLEELVHSRTVLLEEEKQKTDKLLYQMLPRSVADQLKMGLVVEAEYFDDVSIYFSDIVGFTKLASESSPLEIVEMLNELYTAFDSIIDNYKVYKVETIGDAYMVVSGLPERIGNSHASEIAVMSLELLAKVKNFSIRHKPGYRMQLRVGIHSGSVVAGVVGLKMPRYCLFGDTVNTASRMESGGLAMMIQVSSATHHVLCTHGGFQLEKRGQISVKVGA